MNMPSSHQATDTQQGAAALSSWTATLSSSLRTLHCLAGTTERECLQIGSQMQVIYYHSAQLSSTAQLLAEIASGARLDQLTDQLRQTSPTNWKHLKPIPIRFSPPFLCC